MSRMTISVQDVDWKMRFTRTIVFSSSQNSKQDRRSHLNAIKNVQFDLPDEDDDDDEDADDEDVEDENDENNDPNVVIVEV